MIINGLILFMFFFKQKTAYEMRISDWSSDVCSSDLGRSVSYSELLGDLGFRFTRPKMRAVCKTLEEVDRLSAAGGEPDLAVLVVRESDRLPGQGWWVGGTALLLGYDGPWEGSAAARFLRAHKQAVFDRKSGV